MTVRDLLEALEGIDPDRLVVMSKDSEGNGYSPLADVNPDNIYVADSTWSGDIWPGEYDSEWFDDQEDFETIKAEGVSAVVLWPTN